MFVRPLIKTSTGINYTVLDAGPADSPEGAIEAITARIARGATLFVNDGHHDQWCGFNGDHVVVITCAPFN